MAHRLVTAYREGRKAFPHTLLNPYAGAGDRAVARMWRLGWQRAAEDSRGIPPEAERIERLVVTNAIPFLPGYRWHYMARIWRTPILGELSDRYGRRPILIFRCRAGVSDSSNPNRWRSSVSAWSAEQNCELYT